MERAKIDMYTIAKRTFGLLLLAVLFLGCRRDELCYLHPQGALVRIEIDWSKAKLKPSGATVKFYKDGVLYRPSRDFEFMNLVEPKEVFLPVGNYKILVFNESPEDYRMMSFRDEDQWSTFKVVANEDPTAKGYTRTTVMEPDTLAVGRIWDFTVTPEMVLKHHVEPTPKEEAEKTVADTTLLFTPERVFSVAHVTVEVTNLIYAKSYNATLYGMARSYMMGTDRYGTDPVNYLVKFESMTVIKRGKLEQDGILYAGFMVIGLTGDTPVGFTGGPSYLLDLKFTMVDDEISHHTFDLVSLGKIKYFPRGSRSVPYGEIEVNASLTLPEKINIGDGFLSDLLPWKDVVVSVPL